MIFFFQVAIRFHPLVNIFNTLIYYRLKKKLNHYFEFSYMQLFVNCSSTTYRNSITLQLAIRYKKSAQFLLRSLLFSNHVFSQCVCYREVIVGGLRNYLLTVAFVEN